MTTFMDTPEGKDYKTLPGPGEDNLWLLGSRIGAGWAVQKGEIELIEKVNSTIESLLADCTYTNIRKEYISVPTLTDEPANCQ